MTSDLSASAKLIFGKIASLSRTEQGCRLSNVYLKQVGSCSVASVTRILHRLVRRKLITSNGSRNNRKLALTAAGERMTEIIGGRAVEEAAPAVETPAIAASAELVATPVADTPTPEPKKERKRVNPTIEDHCAMDLPAFIPADAWRDFVTYRHSEKGPFSERAAKGVITEIETLRSEGHDPRKLLELAARRGWLVPYPDKDGRTKGGSLTGDKRMSFGGMPVLY